MTDWREKRTEAQQRDWDRVPPVPPKVAPDCAHCQSPHWYLKWTEQGWLCDVCTKYTKDQE